MAKSRATQQQDGYDAFGQPIGAPKGEPDARALVALEEVHAAPEVPEDEPEPTPAAGGLSQEARQALMEAIKDKEIALQLARTLAQTPEGRRLFKIPAGHGAPSGYYHRNYANEPALRVTGGLEVAHEDGFRPLPPSYITMYLTADGRKTNHESEAAKDAQGNPALTDEYKLFLDKRMEGKRIDGRVQTDIAVGQFVPDDAGVAL